MNPYQDHIINETVTREFAADTDPMSLIWHEDQEDRIVEILVGNGWQFQFDEIRLRESLKKQVGRFYYSSF